MKNTFKIALASLTLTSALFQTSHAVRISPAQTTHTAVSTAAGVATAVLIQDRHKRAHEIIGSTVALYSEELSGVTLTVKQLNVNNTNLFSKKRLLKRYQPLEITIQNATGKPVRISKESLNIPLEQPRRIARKLESNPVLAFFWPWQSMTPTKAYATIFLGPFGSLGVTLRDNKRLRQQFDCYATDLNHDLYVPAHGVLSRYIYVPKEVYLPEMVFSVFDGNGQKLDYNVKLKPSVIL